MSDESKFDRYFSLTKFVIGTVGLGLVTVFVNDRIQQREVDIKERTQSQENLSRYIELAIDKDMAKRRDFAKYFAHLSRTEEERRSWTSYLAFVESEISVNKQRQEDRSQDVEKLKVQFASLAEQLLTLDEPENRGRLTVELAATQTRLNSAKAEIAQLREDLSGSRSDVLESDSVQSLVWAMDSPVKQERLNSTGRLIAEHPESPQAVRLALDMLTEPYLNELSDHGRVNILVYLASTLAPAWTPGLFKRWDSTLENVERRHAQGIAQIGPITRERIEAAKRNIDRLRL